MPVIAASILLLAVLLTACSGGVEMKKNNKTNPEADNSPDQYGNLSQYVTQQCGTEPAFHNAYWNEHRPGIYVDINTGKPLFSSLDKFDSGTGWPSFTRPLANASIAERNDSSLGMQRIEVHTNASHLGHVFDDGPNGSLRYCINSASLRFVPYADLDKEGYSAYKSLFHFENATFAGGCFWGTQKLFENLSGVIAVTAGYSGGTTINPTYEEVSSGTTGHAESVQIIFDPAQISYRQLVDYFWRVHDPTQVDRQGPDVGTQYRSVIFYNSPEQQRIAEESKTAFAAKKVFDRPIATQIVPFKTFYPAEDYHQDYYKKHPGLVCHVVRDV